MSDHAFIGPRSEAQLRLAVSCANTSRMACRCGWGSCCHLTAYQDAKHELAQYIKQSGDWRESDGYHLSPLQNVATDS